MKQIGLALSILLTLSYSLFATDHKTDNEYIKTSSDSPSNYITSRDIIRPDFGNSIPIKGEVRIDSTTGVKITRLTDASELDGTNDALIVYSRYSPENTSGKYFLTFGSNSTTSWIIDRETGLVITKLSNVKNKDIGESHEVRWDISGNKPDRLYYRYAMSFYKVDVIKTKNKDTGEHTYSLEHTLLKDFSSLAPNATKLYNDVEGDSSNDSDHWAFMAAHYDGVTYVVDAFIHYQISTGDTHTMTAQDLAGSPLNHYAEANKMPRPNMVEINPTGTGIVLHFGRSWTSGHQSNRPGDIGTYFDGAHLWPLDFKYTVKKPVKISISETHSGWAFDEDGREMFISQNNRKDTLDGIYNGGANSGYDHRVQIAKHKDFGWSTGFHYGKMPLNRKGWAFINTYANVNKATHQTDWAVDQLIMMEIDSESNDPKIWRIAPNYNRFSGHYRDEAPAAINTQGNRIYVATNWGGRLTNREVFLFELPANWDLALSPSQ